MARSRAIGAGADDPYAIPGATSFVVELHPGTLGRAAAFRHAGAVLELARQLPAGG